MKTLFQKLERLSNLNPRSTQSYLMQREHSKSDASTRVVGTSPEVRMAFSGKTSASKYSSEDDYSKYLSITAV